MADWLLNINWSDMFMSHVSPIEIIIRGSLIYWGIFILLRVIRRREMGSISTTDVLVLVLLADAAQNGMAGDYKSITDGLLLVAVIIFWSFAIDWLSYHYPAFERLIHPPEITLVEHGRVNKRHMRQEMVTEDEIQSELRKQGLESLDEVKKIVLEDDGNMSIIPWKKDEQRPPKRRGSIF